MTTLAAITLVEGIAGLFGGFLFLLMMACAFVNIFLPDRRSDDDDDRPL